MKSFNITKTTQHLNAIILGMAGSMLILCAGPLAHAAGVPNTFSAGDTVSSSQMNDNFTAVETDIANPIVTGNIDMVPATGSTGVITKYGISFLHDYGTYNTFLGTYAGNFTMSGGSNTGTGYKALTNNTSGGFNTASGMNALINNTTGGSNTASGYVALYNSSSGGYNTADGRSALYSNTTGGTNTASGAYALYSNTNGANNTACGGNALYNNSTGSNNIAAGYNAGSNLTTGNNNIDIGSLGVAAESNTIRIGTSGTHSATYIAGITGVTTGGAAVAVFVDGSGQLGTISSSRRYKDDIAEMGASSDVLMQLRPVTFHYKVDRKLKARPLQYGLIAEEVQQVAPQLVANNAKGEPETVYYQFLAPMLLNEYQKQQRTIQAQAAQLTEQKARVAALEQQTKQIVALRQEVARMSALLARLDHSEKLASASR